MQRQDWDGAIAAARSAIVAYPVNAKYHALLGLCYFRKGSFHQAVDPLRRATILDPNFVDAGIKLAQSLDRSGDYVEAHRVAEEFLRLRPADRTLQGLVMALQDHRDRSHQDGWERSRRLDHVSVRLASEDGEGYVMGPQEEKRDEQSSAVFRKKQEGFAY